MCVETKGKNGTDVLYINTAITHFYGEKRGVVRRYLRLGSKYRYNSRANLKAINDFKKNSCGSETSIVYFIDVDKYDIDMEARSKFDEIRNYCQRNNYGFVFFSKDIEDVFLGHQVSDSEKDDKAREFARSKNITKVSKDKLISKQIKKHFSNMLTVLDSYFA